jgi:hypothetical protein
VVAARFINATGKSRRMPSPARRIRGAGLNGQPLLPWIGARSGQSSLISHSSATVDAACSSG